MSDTGARQSSGQNEHGPHGDHCGTAETRQSLLRRDQPGQSKGLEHQQPHHIHAQPTADEKDKRDSDNRKQCNDLKRQSTSLFRLHERPESSSLFCWQKRLRRAILDNKTIYPRHPVMSIKWGFNPRFPGPVNFFFVCLRCHPLPYQRAILNRIDKSWHFMPCLLGQKKTNDPFLVDAGLEIL